MKNMSFAMTTEQILSGTKCVTRRFGWWDLKSGDIIRPVRKTMGLEKGEHVEYLRGPLHVLSTRKEPLCAITTSDCLLEGFPHMSPEQFVRMIRNHYGCPEDAPINRIEFAYTDETPLNRRQEFENEAIRTLNLIWDICDGTGEQPNEICAQLAREQDVAIIDIWGSLVHLEEDIKERMKEIGE